MSILKRLSENIVSRDLRKDGAAILSKWEETGLLEGIVAEQDRENMARLLENQAEQMSKQMLKEGKLLSEASTMSGGDVEGFAAVAFPIVRRVFGQLIANNLVSVQPMSLPTGLIFFMDFTYTNSRLGGYVAGESVFGQGAVGSQIAAGVSLTGASAEKSFYNLNQGYSSPTASAAVTTTIVASGTVGGAYTGTAAYVALGDRLVRYDPDLSGSLVAVATIPTASLTNLSVENLITVHLNHATGRQQRRLTIVDPLNSANYLVVVAAATTETTNQLSSSLDAADSASFVIVDNFTNASALGGIVGTTPWGLENNSGIPEIDIKVDAISITAVTKKLKAVWTPEIGQDLQAYHNTDAEVELTQVLSEHVALEIDREIVEDLVKGATAGTYYWSRQPGNFIKRDTGASVAGTLYPEFTGTVSEWYETLLETVNDISAQIQRRMLRGGATFLVCGPEVANILEFTSGFRAEISGPDAVKGSAGAYKVGAISRKWDVYVDPYFPRNLILIGRKGASFLETGYVYAPYVPLQLTPLLLDPDSFVPRKGLLTRYATRMVRPDAYGLVVIQDLLGN